MYGNGKRNSSAVPPAPSLGEDSYILGVYCGISTVQLQKDRKHVNIQGKQKPFMMIVLQQLPSPVPGTIPPGNGMPGPFTFYVTSVPWRSKTHSEDTYLTRHLEGSQENYGGTMRHPLNVLGGPEMPRMNMVQVVTDLGQTQQMPIQSYSSASPGNYVDSTNSGDNLYTFMNTVPARPNRLNFPMGPGSDGPMSGLGGIESHHMNGSLGSGGMDSISKFSPTWNSMTMSVDPSPSLVMKTT
ncbi:hypothetical protein QTO34_001128, partial [Cnephaeus nilssonii]